jgi:hypothetical protein
MFQKLPLMFSNRKLNQNQILLALCQTNLFVQLQKGGEYWLIL